MATLEERYAKKEQELQQLKAQMQKKKARERTQAEKWRTSALIQIGGVVLAELGIKWTEMDPAAFEKQFANIAKINYKDGTPIFDCKVEPARTPKEAHEVWVDFKETAREKRRAERTEQHQRQYAERETQAE